MPNRPHPFVAVLLALSLLGCGTEEAKKPAAPATPPAAQGPDPAAAAPLAAVLAPYESLRALLADDAIAAVAEPAGALATAAESLTAKASEASAPTLTALAAAARTLQSMDKSDADAVRKQFGEVSRAYVALLQAEPSLRAGRYLFHCPMAQGFTTWVQTTETLANPYMGTQMLKCGSKRGWE